MPEAVDYLKSIQPSLKKLAKLYIDSADWFVLRRLFNAAFAEFNNQPAVLLNSKALTNYLTYNAKHDYYQFNDNYNYYVLNQDLYQREENRLTRDKLKEFANQANFDIQFDYNLVFNYNQTKFNLMKITRKSPDFNPGMDRAFFYMCKFINSVVYFSIMN